MDAKMENIKAGKDLKYILLYSIATILVAFMAAALTSPLEKSIYTGIACIIGTIVSVGYFYGNKSILKIANYGNLLSALFTLVLPLICLSLFLLLSKINITLLINLFVSGSIGLSLPVMINYIFDDKEDDNRESLKWRQIIFMLYFWVFTAISCFGENILDNKIAFLFPLILGGCTFVILGIILVGTLFANADSKFKNPSSFPHTFFIIFLLSLVSFVLLYYIFQVDLYIIYPLLLGSLAIILLYGLSLFKNIEESHLRTIRILFIIFIMGGLILLVNRLNGAYGLALCSFSLLLGSNYIFGEKKLYLIDKAIVLGVAVMLSRVILQLYLERTNLVSYGINITTAYSYGMLVAGMAIPVSLGFAVIIAAKKKILGALITLFIITLPVITGLFLHTEAVASFIFSFLGVSLIGGTILFVIYENNKWLKESTKLVISNTYNLLIPVIISITGLTILSAGFVIYISDLTRMQRLIIFVAYLLIIFVISLINFWQDKKLKAESSQAKAN